MGGKSPVAMGSISGLDCRADNFPGQESRCLTGWSWEDLDNTDEKLHTGNVGEGGQGSVWHQAYPRINVVSD